MSSTRLPARRPPKKTGDNLVPCESTDTLPSQLERLLRAFQRCDDAARREVLIVAERLSGAAQ
jgi:hypothetical protein